MMMKFDASTLMAPLATVTFMLSLAILVCGSATAQESFDSKARVRVVYGDTDQIVEPVLSFKFKPNTKYTIKIETTKKTVLLVSKRSTDSHITSWVSHARNTYSNTSEFMIDSAELPSANAVITVWGDPEEWSKGGGAALSIPLKVSKKTEGSKPVYTFEYEYGGSSVKLTISRA
jgi:hypothetical protein